MAAEPRSERERTLLDEGEALRRLARGLLGPRDAEDVVQSTCAAALEAPARIDGFLQPWLRVTLQRLAATWRRGEQRRQRRERMVARDELHAGSDPAAIAMQVELMQDLAAAVRALDEPFRTAVVLRYLRGMLPDAIAQELGVPRNTVRSRLQRGLERLRRQLDDKHGERDRWSAPLLGLTGAPTGLAATAALSFTIAGLLMQTKLLVGGAAVLLAVLAVSLTWRGQEARSPAADAAALPPVASVSGHGPEATATPLERTAVAPAAVIAAAPDPDRAVVRLRCVDAEGQVMAGCEARLRAAQGQESTDPEFGTEAASGTDGRIELSLVPAAMGYELAVQKPGMVPLQHWWNELEPARIYDLGDAVMVAGGGVAGRVLDGRGAPQAGVPVRFFLSEPATASAEQGLRPVFNFDAVTRTDGSFEQRGPMVPGKWLASLMPPYQTSGLQGVPSDPVLFTVTAGSITGGVDLTCPVATASLRGVVVGPDGAPIAGAEVTRDATIALLPTTHTDALGQFHIPRFDGESVAFTRLKVVAAGFELTQTGRLAWDVEPVRIVLQRGATVGIEVVADDSGAVVEAFGLGLAQYPGTRNGAWLQLAWPCLPRPHGQLQIDALPRGRYVAWVTPKEPRLAAFLADFTVDADSAHCQLRAPRAGQRLVRVVDGADRPVSGTRLELVQGLVPGDVTVKTEVHRPRDLAGAGAVLLQRGDTDANGEVTLHGGVGVPFALRLLGPGHRAIVIADVRLDDGLEPLVVQVDVGATVFGKLAPASVREQLGPSPQELQTAASFGDRGATMLQNWRPQVLLRRLGGDGSSYPEKATDGAVDTDGSFRIDGVPEGSWQACLRYRLPGISRESGVARVAVLATVRELHGSEERRVDLDCSALATGSLQAIVLVDGVPFANDEVELLYRDAALQWGTFTVGEASVRTSTDAEGRISADLPAGDWGIAVTVPGQNGGEATLRSDLRAVVTPGQTASMTFALQRRTLRAHILRADGTPEIGRRFLVLQEHYIRSAGKTDDGGWLDIDSVMPGAFELVAWPAELAEQKAQNAYIKEHPYPQWLDALIRLGPVSMPAGQTEAEVELRLPR